MSGPCQDRNASVYCEKYRKGKSSTVISQVLQSHSSFVFLSRISIALLCITSKNSSECYNFTFCESRILTKITIPVLDLLTSKSTQVAHI